MNVLNLLFFITLSFAENPETGIALTYTAPKTPEQLRLLDNLLELDCTIDSHSNVGFFLCDHGKTNVFFILTDVEMWPLYNSWYKSCSQYAHCKYFSNYHGTTVRFTRNAHGNVFYTILEPLTGKILVNKKHVPIDSIEIEDKLLK